MLDTTEKGGVRNSIKNCLTVFQHDPLLSGAIAYNLLTDRTDIVKPIGYDRSPSASMTDTDMKYIRLYSGIGINKLREITNEDRCKFVLWVGNKRLIKRRLFDQFIEQAYSI